MDKLTRIIYSVYIGTFIWLLASCAKPISLTGGEKDVTPPQILKQEPANEATNFKGTTVKILFDEYVELNNPSENFYISPPLKETPEYTLKGKSLIINLNNPLDSNTTYTIFCNEGIKDLREGNVMPPTSFVFSTGDYVDSMILAGCVIDALTLLPKEKAAVMLYKQYDDSTLMTELPYYITFTNKEGQFLFTNIADGEYHLCALVDKNRNNIYDQKDEQIAFSSEPVKAQFPPKKVLVDSADNAVLDSLVLDNQDSTAMEIGKDSTETIDSAAIIDYSANTLMLFEEADTNLRFMKREYVENHNHKFTFKGKVTDFKLNQLNFLDTAVTYLVEYNPACDTLNIYFTQVSNNVIDFELVVNDVILDTLDFNPASKQKPASRGRRSSIGEEEPKDVLTYKEISKGELNIPTSIRFNEPVKTYDSTKWALFEFTKDDTLEYSVSCYLSDSSRRTLVIDYPFKEKTNYQFFCSDSAFWSYYELCNDTIWLNFTTKSTKDYGSLKIKYEFFEENHYILQLLNEKSELVQEDFSTYNSTISYDYLPQGKYCLRVIVDENNNQQWDAGNYLQRIQPERIFYFEKTLEVMPNWKIEETFSVVTIPVDY
ncbi:MAG: Ig-like domain-containing protein [Lentimicrobiaceae bacterium]|nr:Ig-like domain-containing protein [Lentimicrobiaceae bacterium]